MFKRWLTPLIAAALLFMMIPGLSSEAAYSDDCFTEVDKVRHNQQNKIFLCVGNQFVKTDVPVEIENGTTLLPMRALLERLKTQFSWDSQNQTINVQLNGKTIRLQIDKKEAIVNGQRVTLNTPPRLKDGRVLIPVRFISEQLDFQVSWLPASSIVKVFPYPELTVARTDTVSLRNDDYYYGNYLSHTNRYLLDNGKSIILLEAVDRTELRIQEFTPSFSKKGEFLLKGELDNFAGAHLSKDFYYILYTQDNLEESDSKAVYRLVKYDKDWKKTAELDIKDVYVTRPVHASNVTMDSRDGKLVIYTARERYKASDGLNHQSNIVFHIDMDTMTLLYKGGQWPYNHVSHSFATYVRFDGERIVYADHGDAYPRSIVVQTDDNGEISNTIELLKFRGETGNNYTGAHLGGLEVSDSNYLLVGSSVSQEVPLGSSYTKNLFLGVIPKNASSDEDAKLTWMTNHELDSDVRIVETHLVKLSENKFVLLWTEQKNASSGMVSMGDDWTQWRDEKSLFYAVVDGSGNLLKNATKLEGIPSPGHIAPLVRGNSLSWTFYTSHHNSNEEMSDVTEFYTLQIDGS